jgi:pilus assembly protein CpaE
MIVYSGTMEGLGNRIAHAMRTRLDPQGPVGVPADAVARRLPGVRPEMVVVVLSPNVERGLEVLGSVRKLHTGSLLAVGPVSDPKLILRALQQGAENYLDEAAVEQDLEPVVARLQNKDEASAPAGRLVALLGASGGSGTSTLAVNIAAVLAAEVNSAALVDLKPGRGDLAALLDLKPSFSLADICLNGNRLDRAMFEKILTNHASKIRLLASPQVFGSTRMVTSQGVNQALTMARRLFACVVADLEDCFHEEQMVALRQADAVLVVARLDFTSLRNVRRIVDHLRDEGIERSRLQIVINRHGQPNELPPEEAEEALGGKPAHLIPDDPKTVNGANNTGIPLVLKSPTTKVAKAITQLALHVFDRRKPEVEKTVAAAAGPLARLRQVFSGRAAM